MQADREIVKAFVSANWTDEKIAQVYAFNEDGKVDFMDPCACIVGVHSSEVLHTRYTRHIKVERRFLCFKWEETQSRCPELHYLRAKGRGGETLASVEVAYLRLKYDDGYKSTLSPQAVLSTLLREIMTERESARQKQSEARELVAC